VLVYAIGFGGCVTILSLHVILAYLRKAERQISISRPRPASHVAVMPTNATVAPHHVLDDPRVSRIISEIPQRRIRKQTRERELAAAS